MFSRSGPTASTTDVMMSPIIEDVGEDTDAEEKKGLRAGEEKRVNGDTGLGTIGDEKEDAVDRKKRIEEAVEARRRKMEERKKHKRKLTPAERKKARKARMERRKTKQTGAMVRYAEIREERLAAERKRMEIARMRREQGSESDEEINDDWKYDAKKEELFTWDVCMVFDMGSENVQVKSAQHGWKMDQARRFQITTARTIETLHQAGLKTSVYRSVDQKDPKWFCLVGASENRLEEEADRIDMDIELEMDEIIKQGKDLDMPLARAIDAANRGRSGLDTDDWFPIYGKFDRFAPSEPQSRLYKRQYQEGPLHEGTVFRTVDRIKLIQTIIEADPLVDGAGLSISHAIASDIHSLVDFFPLHQEDRRARLKKRWVKWDLSFSQPVHDIREYFGERVAIYFAFLSFYCHALILPAIIGLGIFIWQMVEGRVDVEAVPFYGLFVAFWSTIFLELWKRKEAMFRVQWGMSEFDDKEQPRPDFQGEKKRSPINGGFEKQFSATERLWRMILSESVIFGMIIMVILSVVGIMFLRKVLVDWDDELGGLVAGIVNAIQIQIFNVVYSTIAVRLNDYENFRTQTEYENALIAKSFIFKFVNSYNSLIYIAFFKQYDSAVGNCKNDDCLGELQIQLGTLFISLIVVNNALEIGLPMCANWWTSRKDGAGEDGAPARAKSQAERDFDLEEYESTFDDFDEMAIQYGYVSLFVVAFPLAPLLALLNNYLEIRLDATKLISLTKRPEPQGATNIGTWYDIYEVISFVSVVTNAAIIAFNVDIVSDWAEDSSLTKVWVFVGLEHFIFIVKAAIGYFLPDEAEEVTIHLERQRFLVDVLLDDKQDENEQAIRTEEAAVDGAMNYSEEKGEEVEIGGLPEREWWNKVARAVPDVLHLWEMNTLEKVKGRSKWVLQEDESEEFDGAADDRMALNLLLPMQIKVKDGGFVHQPPEFWMMYDLMYLGTIFSTQHIYLNYSGNDVMEEREILAKLQQLGGVPNVAFSNDEFIKYLRWWMDRRRPPWSIYLSLKPEDMTKHWLSRTIRNLHDVLSWRYELMLSRDGIIVKPTPL